MRERLLALRRAVERLAVLRGLPAEAVERFAAGLRAVEARLEPAVEDFARAAVERFAVERFAADDFAAERVPVARLEVELLEVERFAVERLPDDLRVPLRAPPEDDPERLPEPSSPLHFPDITRLAASATASAISDPNFVALAIMLVAALEAVSAASSPASRIARRAFGLALIAAAAAARPAASISLLMAAFASLSTVSDLLDEDREELFLGDFAIVVSPCVAMKSSLAP